ncbi:hypothetical protein F4604DRAFT_1878546 [Suillus subluteus]|nr:hypothetical protein F4604DRAFT_1878546 [Suillus subluteus]
MNDVKISNIVNEFTLNTEQTRAFQIVAEHSLRTTPETLCMFIGGAGGTGKSHIINVLKEFFHRWNQSRRFCLASYTGVAAKKILGMTLHSALSIDLVAMWEGVDYLFVDEVSMIGCNFLLQISEALQRRKGRQHLLGQ